MNKCIICLIENSDLKLYACYPCGHYGICNNCRNDLNKDSISNINWNCITCNNINPNETLYCTLCFSHIYENIKKNIKCPICRKEVKEFLKIYIS